MSDELVDALRDNPYAAAGPRTSALFRLIGALWNGGLGSPWIDRATAQTKADADAYQQGGVPALMANTQEGQDLAGGFGGTTKAVGGKAAKVAALGGELPLTGGRATVPPLRGLPRDEAIAIARTEPHLLPAGKGDLGAYRGGPESIKGPEDLAARRNYFDQYVAADPRGGDWYDRYRAAVNEVTGGNPTDNLWMTRQHGQWSAGVSPQVELGFTLKENNARLAGMPTKAGRPASHKALESAIEQNDPSMMARGKKTGEYATRNNPDLHPFPMATGVNDFRHQVNLGYPAKSGDTSQGGIQFRGVANHNYMDYETALAVDRANAAQLGGRSDWTGEQLQAAPWVRQKALEFSDRYGIPYEEAFQKYGNTQIGDYFDKHTFNATHEAYPGASTGHLPESVNAGQDTRTAYAQDPRSTWAFAPGGRDAIYSGMRLGDTGVAMRTRPSTDMQGYFEGGFNPGEVARPLVAFDNTKAGKSIAPADRALLEAGEATRGFIDAQDAAAGHINFKGGPVRDSSSVFAAMPGQATPEQMKAVQAIGAPAGLTDVVDTGRGLTMTNFGGGVDPKVLSKALKGDLQPNIMAATGASDVSRVKTDPVYIDYTGAWKQGVGSDAATKQMLEYVNRTPQIRAALNNNPMIPQKALGNMERDAEYAASLGATRKDIQEARRIIGDGPGWIDRLEANLGKGVLPAIGAALLGQAAFEEPQQAAH